MKKYIVDRFEDEYAVIENESGGSFDIKRELIPQAEKGDVLVLENGVFQIDKEESIKRKKQIVEKMNKLFEKKNNL